MFTIALYVYSGPGNALYSRVGLMCSLLCAAALQKKRTGVSVIAENGQIVSLPACAAR